jgi:hypothetical protein
MIRIGAGIWLSGVLLVLGQAQAAAAQSSSLDDFRRLEVVQNESDADPLDSPTRDQISVYTCWRRAEMQPDCDRRWDAPTKGTPVMTGDSIRVGRSYRAAVNVELSRRDFGVIVLAPQVFTRENDTTFVGPLVSSGMAEYAIIEGAGIEVRRGALIATRCPGRAFVMVVNGENLRCRGTTWLVAVDEDDDAWLYVQEGTLVFDSGIPAGTNSAWTWGPGETPRPVGISALQAQTMRDAIEYNGDRIWRRGFNPLLLLPLAIIPPLVIIIVDGDGDGLSGTVRVPLP